MSELNINNLPAEILTEVFGYLNERNLKNVTIVCQLWNSLIKSAFRWSLKLKYNTLGEFLSNIPDDAQQLMNCILTTNRKFGTLEIYGGRLNEDNQIVEIFKRHGFNVVELHFRRCRIDNLTGFAELLRCTPNLKHVVVDTQISHVASDVLLMDQLLPDFKNLKSLVIYGNDFWIIECFRKAKLTTMEFYGALSSEHRSLLVDFLSTQDKLTSISVDTNSLSVLVEMRNLNFPSPFRLTQFSVSGRARHELEGYEIHSIIESQAGNLTEIRMESMASSSLHDCFFANMTKLSTLSMKIQGKSPLEDLPLLWDFVHSLKKNLIDQGDSPPLPDFFHSLKENRNVQTVRLLDDYLEFDSPFVSQFLRKFPNIRDLFLRWVGVAQYSSKVAQILSKLESLHIERMEGTPLGCVKFPNLKTLQIENLGRKINWNEFTKAHPLLTKLTIESMDRYEYLTIDDLDQITTNVDLQHIRLGAGFRADSRFFEIIGSKCTNLKVLDLHQSCISQNIGHYLKIDVLRLRDNVECRKVFRSRFLS